MLRKIRDREEGAAAVIAAIAFTILVAIGGLVIDLGSAYMKGSDTQNAADAAAFAAGTLLPADVGNEAQIQEIRDTVADYAVKNGFSADSVEAVELEDIAAGKYYGVRVRLRAEVSYGFGPILGMNGTTVTKDAKVQIQPAATSTDVVPLGIEVNRLAEAIAANECQHVIIKYDGGDGEEGFFGALDLDGVQGGGAQDFASWLAFGYDGVLSIGEELPVETGNMANPTITAFTTRFNQCTHYPTEGGCNAEHFDPGCPRVVTLIVYSLVDAHTVRVMGFVPFVLEGVNGNGEIVASKVTVQTQEAEAGGVIGGEGDYGIYCIHLVE